VSETAAPPRPRPPSIDALLREDAAREPLERYGREAVKEELRRGIAKGVVDPGGLWREAAGALATRFAPTLTRAVNATGVLLHTNLGRAPLSDEARAAAAEAAAGYSTVEYDRTTGERGRRQDHVRGLARDLFGCEDALAVNNNAAAVMLALAALARGRGVLVSRGELVAIGGSFKIPEILEASGARLVEVGTTNRTTADDYRRALSRDVALILTVHPSNYEIRGYTRRPSAGELAALAREASVPWVHDQGTGCVVALDEFGVPGEPTIAECLAAGADVVAFSGDKLLSGPQAGLLAGRADLVGLCASHPIARAVRPDKLTLAALAATLRAWKTGAWRGFPVYRAAAAALDELERRGAAILAQVRGGVSGEVVPSEAAFGGGTSPEKLFPSRALSVEARGLTPDELASRLRAGAPRATGAGRVSPAEAEAEADAAPPIPIVARVERGRVLLDLRSIQPAEDAIIVRALSSLSDARGA
jgi:L-seryl-tRNA(Ser) seleniumtransferase